MITLLKFLVMAIAALAEKAFLTDLYPDSGAGEVSSRRFESRGTRRQAPGARSEIRVPTYGWSSRSH